ncbi:HGGxSTG domain-containing protein [Bradyrhizobium sp. BR 10289]|uniref:HGGxSTG domain-containing protein n=1 Tax=Bradyrhizobium sp. BR 10289 TaxID=2749993 RepID=UPI0024BFC399|nr:HGGxSTG domain-containing protein [Bradyrhizobium sp. BR 10289]
MRSSLRCGAKTRNGGVCCAPALRGKKRCRMHGGAWRSGAPRDNRNAETHGLFTRAAAAERVQMRSLLDAAQELLRKLT